jgi:transcriptional regulator with GAF, ATPase, and Fis domain
LASRREQEGTETLLREGGGFKLKLRSRKVRVELSTGPDDGRVVERAGPEIRVGSARTCHLILTDPTVSRHHFTMRVAGDGVRIVDNGSRNGTYVDGVRVTDAWARPDSRIAAGATTLTLRLLDDLVELPLSQRKRFGELHGESAKMRQLFAILEKVSPTDTTILLEGETGTGKELAAEAIHDASARAGGSFAVFDCSAVSGSLIESSLFGHIKGAFTGAVADRQGAFEAADGGTLFLDEIGELPLELQPKLLRALEGLEVRRLGENRSRRVDVRIIAATNRSLAAEVDAGRFREDLYYRLAVVRVEIPPLRERLDDVAMLAEHFAAQLASRRPTSTGTVPAALPPTFVRKLSQHRWPGNVRELRNAVARALSIGPEDFGQQNQRPPARLPAIDLAVPLKAGRDNLVEEFEKAYLRAALAETGGNITRAADLAGVHRKFIHRAIRRYNLRTDGEGDDEGDD